MIQLYLSYQNVKGTQANSLPFEINSLIARHSMKSYWINLEAVINWLEAGCSPAGCVRIPQPEPRSFLAAWGSPAAWLLVFFSPSWISFSVFVCFVLFCLSPLAAAVCLFCTSVYCTMTGKLTDFPSRVCTSRSCFVFNCTTFKTC